MNGILHTGVNFLILSSRDHIHIGSIAYLPPDVLFLSRQVEHDTLRVVFLYSVIFPVLSYAGWRNASLGYSRRGLPGRFLASR